MLHVGKISYFTIPVSLAWMRSVSQFFKSFPNYNFFKTWFDTKTVLSDVDFLKNQHQITWNNNIVKINTKTLFYRDWIGAGFVFIYNFFILVDFCIHFSILCVCATRVALSWLWMHLPT